MKNGGGGPGLFGPQVLKGGCKPSSCSSSKVLPAMLANSTGSFLPMQLLPHSLSLLSLPSASDTFHASYATLYLQHSHWKYHRKQGEKRLENRLSAAECKQRNLFLNETTFTQSFQTCIDKRAFFL